MRLLTTLAVLFGFTVLAQADDIKTEAKLGGAFNVKAFTGEKKGETLCYVCKFNAESRPAVVLIFSKKADENIATLIKSVDEVAKSNKDLGTVLVGTSGVQGADLEKLQEQHKLTTALTVAVDKDGPSKYNLTPEAEVTVMVYKKGFNLVEKFAFSDTKSAAAKAKDIVAAAQTALK